MSRYQERKARKVCVDCEAPTEGFARCNDCLERGREARAKYDQVHPEVVAARMKRLYWQDPEKFRARSRRIRLEKKLRGECLKCPELAVDGEDHCAKHVELELARKRDYRERMRNGGPLKKGGRKPMKKAVVIVLSRCECGSEKAVDAETCDRCAHLDGSGTKARIITALRGSDGMTLKDLCVALGMNTDVSNGRRQMWRWIKELTEESRIRRYWLEGSETSAETSESYRNGKAQRQHAVGSWAYLLDGKTEREWKRAFVIRWLALTLCWRAANDEQKARAA